MKKLITEVALDGEFNSHLNKIEQAIIKLEKLVEKFMPTSVQVHSIERSANDLEQLHKVFKLKLK